MSTRPPWSLMLVGLAFGFSLSQVGFSAWEQVNDMFAFSDLRLSLTFVCAVSLLGLVWALGRKHAGPLPARSIHPGSLAGGILFGVGWALCGACPSIALVQLGEGQLGALVTLFGVFLGNHCYAVVHERYFRWQLGNCLDR